MSAKKEAPKPQDLSALEDSYSIVGELSARDNIRSYLATRTSDGLDVLVIVEDAPAGDAGNALTHFAADANLLASQSHRNLIPIHDGRWLGENSFALVTARCAAPTLATLVARNESWSYPRIATILHEVNGLLEWARKQKVVHRTLTLDTIHVEPDTDRVLVSFVAQPLTRQGPPGAEGDARTIAAGLIARADEAGEVRPRRHRGADRGTRTAKSQETGGMRRPWCKLIRSDSSHLTEQRQGVRTTQPGARNDPPDPQEDPPMAPCSPGAGISSTAPRPHPHY